MAFSSDDIPYDPALNTTIAEQLSEGFYRICDGPVENIHVPFGVKAGPFYRTGVHPNWKPSTREEQPEYGRFGGPDKPVSIKNAIDLYHLGHNPMKEPWYVHEFYIHGGKDVGYFKCKVKDGTGLQINLNHPAAENTEINYPPETLPFDIIERNYF